MYKRQLQEGKKIKLEYESPWYWLVGISGAARPAEAPKPRERKTRIDLTATSKPSAKASYDLSAQQDEELAPPKLKRQTNLVEEDLNDPIWSRARSSNSPQSLEALPKQLRHFDEVEDAIEAGGGEEGEIVENSA